MEKYSTELSVLETCSASSRPLATDSLAILAGTSTRHLVPLTYGVVKADVVALFQGTGMSFAGGGADGTTPRVRINPSGTTVCDPPV